MSVVTYTKAKLDSLLSRKVSIDDIAKPATETGQALRAVFVSLSVDPDGVPVLVVG